MIAYNFLSYSLDSLVKNLGKDNLKCLDQEFNSKVLDVVNQTTDFILMSIRMNLKSLKKNCPTKKRFMARLQVKY